MKSKVVIVILIIIILLVVVFINTPNLNQINRGDSSSGGKLIGGDQDEHGCYLTAGYRWNKTDQMCVREWEKVACEPSERGAQACTALYEPVCGLPLKKTFSNSCFACQNPNVLYYVPGECLG